MSAWLLREIPTPVSDWLLVLLVTGAAVAHCYGMASRGRMRAVWAWSMAIGWWLLALRGLLSMIVNGQLGISWLGMLALALLAGGTVLYHVYGWRR